MAPNIFVSTNCPIFPTAIATTPAILLFGERKNTRPPYSPILFGVNTAHVKPQKTDSVANHKSILSTVLTSFFHFKASIPQLININNVTILKMIHICDLGIASNSNTNSFRLLFAINFA